MTGCSYTWIVPIKWRKNGGAEQQFWLLDKESKMDLMSELRALQWMEHV